MHALTNALINPCINAQKGRVKQEAARLARYFNPSNHSKSKAAMLCIVTV
jgi:hypothetical protein